MLNGCDWSWKGQVTSPLASKRSPSLPDTYSNQHLHCLSLSHESIQFLAMCSQFFLTDADSFVAPFVDWSSKRPNRHSLTTCLWHFTWLHHAISVFFFFFTWVVAGKMSALPFVSCSFFFFSVLEDYIFKGSIAFPSVHPFICMSINSDTSDPVRTVRVCLWIRYLCLCQGRLLCVCVTELSVLADPVNEVWK